MQFIDLKAQYAALKEEINAGIQSVLDSAQFIGGPQVKQLEKELADFVGRKHCITCANGKNTRDSMRSGIMFGAAAMLDGLLERMEQELGTPVKVIATGGIAKFVIPLCRREVVYDGGLMLKGLRLLYRRNVR